MPCATTVFIILTGVSGNLGDAVIRRRVLEWSRGLGPIHAYVGRTSRGWVEQLQLADDEIVYPANRRREWLRKLIFGGGHRTLIFDPGEVPLGAAHLKSEIVFLGVVLAIRARGGIVFRPPRAVGEHNKLVGAIYRLSAKLSNVTLWRERSSLDLMRVGRLAPDTAFGEPRSVVEGRSRDFLLVSMRGKRPFPTQSWIDGIRSFAAASALDIVVCSQVDEDELRSGEIAAALGRDVAHHEVWGSLSDLDQERRVRELYTRCALVVSDRLHVLILSAQAGAVPVELAAEPKPKVQTHFATVGITGMSLDVASAGPAEIVAFLKLQSTRSKEISEKLDLARADLGNEIARVKTLIELGGF